MITKTILSDFYGNPINSLTQWDSNVVLYIRNWKYNVAPIIHYLNRLETKSYVTETTLQTENDNKTVVLKIPNILLQGNSDILMYIALPRDIDSDDTEMKVLYREEIKIQRRKQPDDYIYEDNVEFIELKTVLDQLRAAIAAFNAETQQLTEYLTDFTEKVERGDFDGEDGEDGFSPIVTITANDNILTIQVVDATGTKTATLTAGTGISITNGVIAATLGWDIVVGSELPVSGVEQTFYFIHKTDPEQGDVYDEYIWIKDDKDFEHIGSTSIDLSNYLSKDEAERLYQKKLSVGNGIDITNDTISAKGIKYPVEYYWDTENNEDVLKCRKSFNDIANAIKDGYSVVAVFQVEPDSTTIAELPLLVFGYENLSNHQIVDIVYGATPDGSGLALFHNMWDEEEAIQLKMSIFILDSRISQTTGHSEEDIMSQDATTRELGTKVNIAQGSGNVGKAMIVGNDGNLTPREYCYVFEFDTDVTNWTTTARQGTTYQAIEDALSRTKDVYLLSHLNTGTDAILVVSEDGLTNNYIRATGVMLPFGQYFAGVSLSVDSNDYITTTVTPFQAQLTAGQNITIDQNNQISAGLEVV